MSTTGKRYPLLATTLLRSTLGGWRLNCYGPNREPLASLWGEEPRALHAEAERALGGVRRPVDSIRAATLWRGRRAAA